MPDRTCALTSRTPTRRARRTAVYACGFVLRNRIIQTRVPQGAALFGQVAA